MSGDAVADAARAACRRALTGRGLRQRAGTTSTFEVDAEVLGFLGLNVAANWPTGPFAVNPVVGARHQELELQVAALTGEKASRYAPPTVSSPLGYLLPEGRFAEWEFPDVAGADRAADGLAAAVQDHGLPFAQQHGSLEAIVDALASGTYGFPQQTAVRLPVGLALLGRTDEGRQAVERAVAALGDRTDLAAQWVRSFADRWAERFGAGGRESGPAVAGPDPPIRPRRHPQLPSPSTGSSSDELASCACGGGRIGGTPARARVSSGPWW